MTADWAERALARIAELEREVLNGVLDDCALQPLEALRKAAEAKLAEARLAEELMANRLNEKQTELATARMALHARIEILESALAEAQAAYETSHASRLHADARVMELEAELAAERAKSKRLREELRDFRDNWDCDEDAHRLGTRCRCCVAAAALRDEPEEPKSLPLGHAFTHFGDGIDSCALTYCGKPESAHKRELKPCSTCHHIPCRCGWGGDGFGGPDRSSPFVGKP